MFDQVLFCNVHYTGHLGVRATTVGKGANLAKLTFIVVLGKQVILGFFLSLYFKPDTMILALFTIFPAQYLTLFDGYFLWYKFEILDHHQVFITTSEQVSAENRD
jgi:hypothetical protein